MRSLQFFFQAGIGVRELGGYGAGSLSVPRHPINLDNGRPSVLAVRRWRLLFMFSLALHFSYLSPSLWEMARQTERWPERAGKPKTTNQQAVSVCA